MDNKSMKARKKTEHVYVKNKLDLREWDLVRKGTYTKNYMKLF